jgi:hypothetical protein
MRTLLLFLATIPAFAAITASPASITIHARQGYSYPAQATKDPARKLITLSGTGAWTAVRSGDLATACGGVPCFQVTATSGSGAGTTSLYWTGLGFENLALGTYTGTITIGSTAIAITLVVEPRRPFDKFVYKAGYPVGCVNSSGDYQTLDTCTITNERPSSSSFVIPAVGGSYVDPQYGHTVRRVTPSGHNIQYGALSAFSATGIYVLTSDSLSSVVDVYRVSTGAKTYSSLPSINISLAAWDPVNDDKLWYIEGAAIKSRILPTGTVTTLVTMPWEITNGGTTDITDDGWWAFRDNTSFNNACTVNLNTGATYCADTSALGISDFDFTQVTQVDSESGKRYVVILTAPRGHVYSVGASGLNYEYAITTFGADGSWTYSDMTAEPHSDVGQDEKGRQIFFWNWLNEDGLRGYIASLQLNKGALLTQPVEMGGGLRILWHSTGQMGSTDAHFGCTWRGVCSYSPYGNSAGVATARLQSITPGNPCQINSASHGYSSTNSVLIGGADGTGVELLSGVHTVTVLDGGAYTIPIDCSSGYTYTANSAYSTLNAAKASNAPFRQAVILSKPGQWARPIFVHRAVTYMIGDVPSPYFSTPRCSISRDASMVACASNMGVPGHPSVYVAYTEVIAGADINVSVSPADTEAVINYTLPASGQGPATITISTLPGLVSAVVSAPDNLSGAGRQYVATGLTADTQYYYRVSTRGFSHTGQFRTSPTLSGAAPVTISKGGGGTIHYGPTEDLGSSCQSPCPLTPSRGLLYHDATGSPTAIVVR